MKKILILAFIFLLITIVQSEQDVDVDLEREEAIEFLKRTFFHPGKTKCEEQKREASEKYEERCEPSVNKLTGKRYCPDIKTWTAFKNYEIGSGLGR